MGLRKRYVPEEHDQDPVGKDTKRFTVDDPVSGGIFLTYKCTGSCRHCMYACSPHWSSDWIDSGEAGKVLSELSERLPGRSPWSGQNIGINRGLHFTGGEPFLNFPLLLELTGMAADLVIRGTFVETNCFWCRDRETTRRKLEQLREAGLEGMLISVNPFTMEQVPIGNCLLAAEEGREVFGRNVLVYQEAFLHQVMDAGIQGPLGLEESIRLLGPGALRGLELLPRGRAVYALGLLYRHHPAKAFFGSSCEEELGRGWHFHVDNYFNYIPGYCGGISLGDARDLDAILKGLDLEEYPIIKSLVTGLEDLYRMATEDFEYREREKGTCPSATCVWTSGNTSWPGPMSSRSSAPGSSTCTLRTVFAGEEGRPVEAPAAGPPRHDRTAHGHDGGEPRAPAMPSGMHEPETGKNEHWPGRSPWRKP
jgi:hypothetical protein